MFAHLNLNRILLCLLTVGMAAGGRAWIYGQATGDPREDFLYGEYYLSMGQYQEALPFFLSALETNPDNANFNYRTGYCYSKILGRQLEALPYLQKAVTEINGHYVEGKYKNTGAPPESWLLLGDTYHRNNQLEKASEAYHTYKNFVAGTDKKMYDLVMQRIMGLGVTCEFQRLELNTPMQNMGPQINSRFSDYNPVLSGDQKTMVYTQYWESYDRIMMVTREGDTWGPPREITQELGSEGNCYTTAMSYDGKELYLVVYDQLDYNIYLSQYQNGTWMLIKPLEGKVNSRYRETSATVSGDGSTLYFASDRPGGFGALDIYRAERQGAGWGEVSNLGSVINTANTEDAPCIIADGTLLFFSSNGHETMGNLDVVFSELDEMGNWSKPINVGSPINTTSDDLFYTYFEDTKSGYFSRDFPDGYGKNDIYMLKGVKRYVASKEKDAFISIPASQSPPPASESRVDPDPYFVIRTNPALATDENPASTLPDLPASGNQKITEPVPVDGMKHREQALVAVNKASRQPAGGSELVATLGDETGDVQSKVLPLNEERFKNMETEKAAGVSTLNITSVEDSIPVYTIQVYALEKFISPDQFSLHPLQVSLGNDGLHRYTYGEYDGWSAALTILDSIRGAGFPDAFIRNIASVSNYTMQSVRK